MRRTAWRIATGTPVYEADDLPGEGAKRTGGRWNEAGLPAVYTADSRALACLETTVHLRAGGLPFNRYLVALAVPDDLWSAAETCTPSSLQIGSDAQPAGRASIAFGTAWLRSGRSTLLMVPSAIVAEEANVLVNPRHPGGAVTGAPKVRRWLYEPRLARSGNVPLGGD